MWSLPQRAYILVEETGTITPQDVIRVTIKCYQVGAERKMLANPPEQRRGATELVTFNLNLEV